MKDIVDKVKNSDTRIQLIVLAIVVLVVIFIGFNRFGGSDEVELSMKDKGDAMMMEDEKNGDLMAEDKDAMMEGDKMEGDKLEGDAMSQNKTTINVALLAGSFYDDADLQGKKRGCDTVVMTSHQVPETKAILNASLKALFEEDIAADFLPGNFIKTQDGLRFSEAKIDNGVAQIFLTGEAGPIAGECDANRTKIQVEETALQFGSVRSAEVYLNGERI